GRRRFLGFLTLDDPTALEIAPAERLTRERVKSFVDHLKRSNTPHSVAIQVDALYKAARIMMPKVNLSWLKTIKTFALARPDLASSYPDNSVNLAFLGAPAFRPTQREQLHKALDWQG